MSTDRTYYMGEALKRLEANALSGAFGNKGFSDEYAKAMKAADADLETAMINGLKSGSIDAIANLGGAGPKAHELKNEKERRAKETAHNTSSFLALLQDLEQQIRALEEEIAGYDKEIDALDSQHEALLEVRARVAADDLDPNDPDDRQLLIASGIDPDDWGDLTTDKIDDYIDGNRSRRDVLKDKRDKKIEEKTKIEADVAEVGEIERRIHKNPEAVLTNEEREKVVAIKELLLEKEQANVDELESVERWFIQTEKEIAEEFGRESAEYKSALQGELRGIEDQGAKAKLFLIDVPEQAKEIIKNSTFNQSAGQSSLMMDSL